MFYLSFFFFWCAEMARVLTVSFVPQFQHVRKQFDALFPALCDNYPDIFQQELYSWDKFLWACELWYSNSMKVVFADGKLRTCLVPVAGFLNHSVCYLNFEWRKLPSLFLLCWHLEKFTSYCSFAHTYFTMVELTQHRSPWNSLYQGHVKQETNATLAMEAFQLHILLCFMVFFQKETTLMMSSL